MLDFTVNCLAVLILGISSSSDRIATVRPVPKPPIQIDIRSTSLEAAAQDLSKKSGRPIYISGTPARHAVEIHVKGTTDEVLAQLCSAYGYRSRTLANGAILLTKRFLDPAQAPDCPEAEIRHTAGEILRILARFNYNRKPGSAPLILAFANQLSDAQTDALKKGKEIKYTELSPAQRDAVNGLILNHLLADTESVWQSTSMLLGNLDRANIVLEVQSKGDEKSQIDRDRVSLKLTVQVAGKWVGALLFAGEAAQ